jgi:hypothetical protein
VVNLQTGALVKEINTGVGNATTKNGLGGVRLVRNASQQVIGVYGGDLYGNMWKFDLSSGAASGVVALGTAPLYTTSTNQPITAAPAVLPHPDGGYMVGFGTGKFFEETDLISLNPQSIYGIWDNVGFGAPSSGSTLSGTARLVQQQVITVPVTTNGVTTNYYAGSNNTVAYTPVSSTSPKGWYMNLQYSGQRVVYPVEVAESPFVIVDSISPVSAVVAGDVCSAANKGQGWSYIMNLLSGGAPSKPIIDINSNGITDAADTVTGASNPSNWIVMGVGTLADGRNTLLGVGSATTNVTTATPTTSSTLGTATLGATNTSSSTTASNGIVTKTTITTVVTAIPGGEGGGYSTTVTTMVTVNPPLSNPTKLVSLSGGSSSAQLFTIDCADTAKGCGCVAPNEYMTDGACCMSPNTVLRITGQADQCCSTTSCSSPSSSTLKGRQWRQLFMR